MLGAHAIAHWSSTQATIALSVAEAELNASIKGATETLFVKHLAGEIGIEIDIEVRTDSSSAKGILNREGCGKVKHLEARQLWLQQKVREKKVMIVKVPREDSPSDALTHYWSRVDGDKHFAKCGVNLKTEMAVVHVRDA